MKNIWETWKFTDIGMKSSCGIFDNSCVVCKLKFPLGERCRKEMVGTIMGHALSEISRLKQLLKQMFLWPKVILCETTTNIM